MRQAEEFSEQGNDKALLDRVIFLMPLTPT